MNKKEEKIISALIEKYNHVLLHSMQIAVTEDLTNLIIANQDDKDFELTQFIKKKEEYKQFVIKEFFRLNSGSVINELSKMEESFIPKKRKKQGN